MFKLNQKKTYLFGLLLIIAVGIFFRAYHFSDWMHFELDQSRDAKVIDLAIERGIGNLPLLGPKAAGSFLRLGPIFYYFEYMGAKIFGNTPIGMAIPNLIFSCLSIPLFYFFIRRFFNEKISLMTTAIFASSFFLVMYSRFAWNPNSLPFFALAAFYALLRAVDNEETRRGWWLVVASVAIAVATQLHFIAFLAIPAITAVYLIFKRSKIKFIFWFVSLFVILLFYIPPIINDIKTNGSNIKEFEKVFVKKSSAGEHTLIEKIARNANETTLGYFLIISGYGQTELPKIDAPNGTDIRFACDNDCEKYFPMGVLALIVLLAGLLLFFKNFVAQKDDIRKDFLILIGLWFLISLVLFTPIAFDLAPRFLLFIAPLPFIFFGLILDFFEKKKLAIISYILIVILIGFNGWVVIKRFQEFKNAPINSFKPKTDNILKEKYRVTLEQQLLIADYMENIYKKNNFAVYVNSEAFYRRAFLYHLEKKHISRDDFRNIETIYQNGNYFLIYPTLSNLEKRIKKYLVDFTINETKEFGTLKVFHLIPKPESIKAIEQKFGPKGKPQSAQGVPVRCRWNEIFRECNTDGLEDATDETDDGE